MTYPNGLECWVPFFPYENTARIYSPTLVHGQTAGEQRCFAQVDDVEQSVGFVYGPDGDASEGRSLLLCHCGKRVEAGELMVYGPGLQLGYIYEREWTVGVRQEVGLRTWRIANC